MDHISNKNASEDVRQGVTLHSHQRRSYNPLFVAGAVFLLSALASVLLIRQSEVFRLQEHRTRLSVQVGNQVHLIQRNIETALSATYALAALVRQGNGVIADFDATARAMLPFYPGAASLQLAPGGIVTYVVPLAGNEKAIGHNLLQDPLRDREAILARVSGKLTLAGPFNLVQGGLGAVGRLPVYLDTGSDKPAFWGFTSVLIRFPQALQDVGLERLKIQGLSYELSRLQPGSGQKQVISTSGDPLDSPVMHSIDLPNGSWTLSMAPTEGWADPSGLQMKAALALLFSLMLGYMAKLLVELRQHKEHLEVLVQQRTAEITATQGKLQATFDAIPDLLFELDVEGQCFACHCPRASLLALVPQEMLGKFASDVMSAEAAEIVSTALHEAEKSGYSGGKQIALKRPAGTMWFELSVARKSAFVANEEARFIVLARDITTRKAAEESLLLAASVFSSSREGIMVTEANGAIIDVNDAFTRITGYSRGEVIGKNPRLLSSGRQGADYYQGMWRCLLEQGYWYGEIWNRRKNGEVYAEMQTISTVRDEQGNPQRYVALFSDITAHKEHQSQLEHIAHYDALTNLPNRVLLADRLHQSMAQAMRRGERVAVLYLDLDGFKAVNDTHGHAAGDHLLITLAARMKESLREGDTLARLGGDEFVAVLISLNESTDSVPTLTRLLDAAALPVMLGDWSLQVSASVGLTFYPQVEDVDADQLLRQADQAMYQAKLGGKNRYHIFDAEQDRNARGQHESRDRIRQGLLAGEFVLHYQPKVNMRLGTVVGAEALVRWVHPQRGLLSPGMFLPVIEEHALAVEMGEWVIHTALSQMALWRHAGLQLQVSVNVGARQLQQSDFITRLQYILASHPHVGPGDLEIEVLETSAVKDLAQVYGVIQACREMGVRFALDDFGTGYSSLTYLKRLPVALLKIDQSFVRNMLDDPDDMAILDGVVGLASAFRREVIAEGVEKVEQGEMLLQLGCELAQGFYIARPMAADEMPAWAANWRTPAAWKGLKPANRVDLPLLFAYAEHSAWVGGLANFLQGEQGAFPPLDRHQCHFGAWLDSDGTARYAAQPAYTALLHLHDQVHMLAVTLCELHTQGHHAQAQAGLNDLYTVRNKLLQQLRALARAI